MKRFILAFLAISAIAAVVPAHAASYNSVHYYDDKRAEFNPSHKSITEAVIDGTIFPEVDRVQTDVVSSRLSNVPVYLAGRTSNYSAVRRHCYERLESEGIESGPCGYSVHSRVFPTISQGF